MRTIKRIIATTLALTFISTFTVLANDQPIRMTLDGQEITFPYQQPVIVDGRTLVPVRGVFEAMGFEVRWDGEGRSVSMDNGEWNIFFVVDSDYSMQVARFQYELPEGQSVQAPTSIRFVDFEVRPQIINGSTMIPLRAIAESVGVEVDWDGETRTVSVGALEWTQTVRQPEPAPEPQDRTTEAREREQETFRLINEYRAEHGIHPLIWHDTLALAARLHSEDVATNMTGLSHVGSDGSEPNERITRLGLSGAFSENMAAGAIPSGVVAMWSVSPNHRNTMMSPTATHAGVGVDFDERGRAITTLKIGSLN